MSSKLESDVCCHLQVAPPGESYEGKTQAWQKAMANYCWVYGVIPFTSPVGWLPVHRDQLRAQRSVTSMGKLYLLPFFTCHIAFCALFTESAERTFRVVNLLVNMLKLILSAFLCSGVYIPFSAGCLVSCTISVCCICTCLCGTIYIE